MIYVRTDVGLRFAPNTDTPRHTRVRSTTRKRVVNTWRLITRWCPHRSYPKYNCCYECGHSDDSGCSVASIETLAYLTYWQSNWRWLKSSGILASVPMAQWPNGSMATQNFIQSDQRMIIRDKVNERVISQNQTFQFAS